MEVVAVYAGVVEVPGVVVWISTEAVPIPPGDVRVHTELVSICASHNDHIHTNPYHSPP